MGVAKYFVWGEGVWREVDLSSGRVVGWRRRARFVFVRRGRLVLARRRTVLRALHALAAGLPAAAADGPRLSHRSSKVDRPGGARAPPLPALGPAPAPAPPPAPPHASPLTACAQHHCCMHYNGCNNNCAVMKQVPLAPPGGPATHPSSPCVRARCEASTQCGVQDAGTSTSTEHARAITINISSTPRSRPASSGDEFVSTHTKRRPNNISRANQITDVKNLFGKHATNKISLSSELFETDDAGTSDARRKNSPQRRPGPLRRAPDGTVARRPGPLRRAPNGTFARRPGPLRRATDGTFARQRPSSSQTQTSDEDREPRVAVNKELVVSEAEVAALRGFVARTRPTALARFDADEDYKRALLYAINPLVELERLSARHAAELPHFAARLGLARRTDLAPPSSPAPPAPPSPPAQRGRTAVLHRERSTSADTDKENKKSKVSSPSKRSVGSERSEQPSKTAAAAERGRATRVTSARLGVSGRDNHGAAADVTHPPPAPTAPPAPQHTATKRKSASNPKEYSNLEDHAIVAWVSSGARASLVNGNRMWRELQGHYYRLTGRSRSWHSIRNRYLRYILPSLGALGLPPADVSRLRAAAATGEINRKNRPAPPPRRNSIFKEPALRGASSRRPRAPAPTPTPAPSPPPARPPSPAAPATPSSSTSTDEERRPSDDDDYEYMDGPSRSGERRSVRVLARSPRYSDVTRRFAARHRPSTPSSTSPATPAPPSSTAPPTRSRRLYNPNI